MDWLDGCVTEGFVAFLGALDVGDALGEGVLVCFAGFVGLPSTLGLWATYELEGASVEDGLTVFWGM